MRTPNASMTAAIAAAAHGWMTESATIPATVRSSPVLTTMLLGGSGGGVAPGREAPLHEVAGQRRPAADRGGRGLAQRALVAGDERADDRADRGPDGRVDR